MSNIYLCCIHQQLLALITSLIINEINFLNSERRFYVVNKFKISKGRILETWKVKSSFRINPITVNKREQKEINTNDDNEADLVLLDRCLGDEILCLHIEKQNDFEWDTSSKMDLFVSMFKVVLSCKLNWDANRNLVFFCLWLENKHKNSPQDTHQVFIRPRSRRASCMTTQDEQCFKYSRIIKSCFLSHLLVRSGLRESRERFNTHPSLSSVLQP